MFNPIIIPRPPSGTKYLQPINPIPINTLHKFNLSVTIVFVLLKWFFNLPYPHLVSYFGPPITKVYFKLVTFNFFVKGLNF